MIGVRSSSFYGFSVKKIVSGPIPVKKGFASRANLLLSRRPASNLKSPLVLQIAPRRAIRSLEGNPA